MKYFAILTCVLFAASVAHAGAVGYALGTGGPPDVLPDECCEFPPCYEWQPALPDPTPVYTDVMDVPGFTPPCEGVISFSTPMSHRRIQQGWATWSHGYMGDVYWTMGAPAVRIFLPDWTCAFAFWAEPNPFAIHNITATTPDGTSVTQAVDGFGGAAGFAFCCTECPECGGIPWIDVTSDVDFAIGEFWGCCCIPEPASVTLMCMAGLLLRRR